MLKSRQTWKERNWEKLILILIWHSYWDFSMYEKNFSARKFNWEELKHEFSQPHFHSCPSAAAARLNFSIQANNIQSKPKKISLFELLFRDLRIECMTGENIWTLKGQSQLSWSVRRWQQNFGADKMNQNVLSNECKYKYQGKYLNQKFQTHIERQVAYLLTQARPHDSRQRTDTRRHAVGRLCRVLVWALRQVDSLIRRVHSSWSKLSTEQDFQRLYQVEWGRILGLVRRGWTWANLLVWSADTIPHIYAIMLEMYIGEKPPQSLNDAEWQQQQWQHENVHSTLFMSEMFTFAFQCYWWTFPCGYLTTWRNCSYARRNCGGGRENFTII